MWKWMFSWCMPRGGWLLAALAFVVGAGVVTPLVAEAATVTVWTMDCYVSDLRIGPSEEVWAGCSGKLGRLDPATNEATTYSHYMLGSAGVVAVDQSGMAWTGGQYTSGGFVIARLDPATLEVTSWPSSSPGSIAIDQAGDVWFTAWRWVLRLNPASNTITKWDLTPFSDVSMDSRQPFDSSGRVWVGYDDGKGAAVLDPTTNELTYWAAPSGKWDLPFVHTDGTVWFAGSSSVARLDLSTNQVTEWPCRAGCYGLHDVRPDATGRVWFAADVIDRNLSAVGWLDPAADPPTFTELPVAKGDIFCHTTAYSASPRGLHFDSAGNLWLFFASCSHAVARLTP